MGRILGKLKLPTGELRSLDDFLSPLSRFPIPYVTLSLLVVIFSPTLTELTVAAGLDFASWILFLSLNQKLFLKTYPEFIGMDQKICQYPRTKTRFSVALSFIRTLIPGYYIIVHWNSVGTTLDRAAIYLGFQLCLHCYYFSVQYLELHVLCSKILTDRFLKGEDMDSETPPHSRNKALLSAESISKCGILTLMMVGQLSLATRFHLTGVPLWSASSFLFFSATFFLLRIRYLEIHTTANRIENIILALSNIKLGAPQQLLAVGTLPQFSLLERQINRLISRLKTGEQELADQIYLQADESRLQSLGEMSALVFHDIKQPIQLISYCVDEIIAHPQKERSPEFWRSLFLANERALAITKNFNHYLRVSGDNTHGTNLGHVHQSTIQILEFEKRKLGPQLEIYLDPTLYNHSVDMSAPDLIHILENIYRNAFTALGQVTDQKAKRLEISCIHSTPEFITLSIFNSGPSLKKAEFEALIHQPANAFYESSRRQSLGLRLIYRLLRNRQGDLSLLESDSNRGTVFLLKLKLHPSARKEERDAQSRLDT